MLEDVRLSKGVGVTIEHGGIFYPGRIIDSPITLRQGDSGQVTIGILYFTRAPAIVAGSEFGLFDGPHRRVAAATAIEIIG